jgi:pectin methylesterase-like acyl-CoA thioesterase
VRILLIALGILLIICPCIASTITVNGSGGADFNTIQDAIDNSSNGDTVVVSPGTYDEKVNFYGRAITVQSTNPDDMGVVYGTIINGGDLPHFSVPLLMRV